METNGQVENSVGGALPADSIPVPGMQQPAPQQPAAATVQQPQFQGGGTTSRSFSVDKWLDGITLTDVVMLTLSALALGLIIVHTRQQIKYAKTKRTEMEERMDQIEEMLEKAVPVENDSMSNNQY